MLGKFMKLVGRVGAKPALSLYWNHLMIINGCRQKNREYDGKGLSRLQGVNK